MTSKTDSPLFKFLLMSSVFSGVFLLTKPKSLNPSKFNPGGSNFNLYSETIFENKEAEIIGNYLNHGIGGTTFRLPSGDVLKIVSLEKDGYDLDGQPNREQAEFIEDLWMQKLDGKRPFSPDFVDIKHYNRGYAGQKMVELVNSEDNYHPLKIGEKIAYWVMEYVPTIGEGTMDDARIRGAKMRLNDWAESKGYTFRRYAQRQFRSKGRWLIRLV